MTGKGQPKGFIGNPTGKNQYASRKGEGQKKEHIGINVVPTLKQSIQDIVTARKEQGEHLTLTDWLEEAIQEKLAREIQQSRSIECFQANNQEKQ
jgi:hypothetical protein